MKRHINRAGTGLKFPEAGRASPEKAMAENCFRNRGFLAKNRRPEPVAARSLLLNMQVQRRAYSAVPWSAPGSACCRRG